MRNVVAMSLLEIRARRSFVARVNLDHAWQAPLRGDIDMKRALVLVMLVVTLASCSKTEKGAAIGAASGAVIGGLVTNDWRGAALGAAAGGATGAVVGNANDRRQCTYRDRYGRRYIERC
jgi:hypothetical protein